MITKQYFEERLKEGGCSNRVKPFDAKATFVQRQECKDF